MGLLVKRGSVLLNEETIAFILAVVGLFVIAYLLFNYFFASFDKENEMVKSYFDGVKKSVEELEKYGVSEYSPIVQKQGKDYYFLVYFGNKNRYVDYVYSSKSRMYPHSSGDKFGSYNEYETTNYVVDFILKRVTSNTLCVCSTSVDDIHCSEKDAKSSDNKNLYGPSDYYSYVNCSSRGVCYKCIDLKWPVEVRNPEPYIFNLNDYSFNFRKVKDSNSKTKYILEAKGVKDD